MQYKSQIQMRFPCRKRGEVKDDYNRIRATRWLAVTQLVAV